ncbi:MAG: hypothetical protein V1747_02280 [Candidatus Omnitrophota bacterium]
MKLKGLMIRGFAVLGLTIICLGSVAGLYAQEETNKAEQKDIFDLVIPGSWGNIKDIYKGSSPEVIVHIQDAHANYEAQTNISNIIDLLVEEYGLKVAGIEGSVGKLNTDLYSTFPEDSVRDVASDFLVRDGIFSGPEALVIRKGFEYPLKLYGIEDNQLYNNNLEAFQTSLPFKEEGLGYLSNLAGCLARLKSEIYNPQLDDIDANQLAFDLKVMSLNDYCLYLSSKLADKLNIANKYPNLALLLNAIKIEKTLDFVKAEEERAKLLTELTNILSEEDIRSLLDKGLAYKNEQMSAARYLSFVKEMALKSEIDFTRYENLDKYITYAGSYDKIKSFELFNEIEEADVAVRTAVYENETQKKLDMLTRGLKVMTRMVEIKMVNKDLAFYKTHQQEFKVDNYLSFIKEQADKFGINVNLPTDIAYLDVYIPAWVDFYQVAGLRNEAMINNTLSLARENNQKVAVMVAGGFHTNELTKKMKAQGVSYIVITPRITKNIQGPYFDRLTGKKTAFEEFIGAGNVVVPKTVPVKQKM